MKRFILLFLPLLITLLSQRSYSQIQGTNALTLNGSEFVRANQQASTSFGTNKNFAFELWFRATTFGALIGEADALDVSAWDVLLATVLPDGTVVVGVPGINSLTVGTVGLNEWHHLVLSYDNQAGSLIGVLDANVPVSNSGTRRAPFEAGRDANYTFGRGGPVNLGSGDWFVGQIDEVHIWNTSLDVGYIASNWNRYITSTSPGLITNWHFDSANSFSSPDVSGKNNFALYAGNGVLLLTTSSLVLQRPSALQSLSATVKSQDVTLNAPIISGSAPFTGYFQWGLTTNYGNVTQTQSLEAGATNTVLTALITRLAPGTYHARTVAVQDGITVYTPDITFTIAPPASNAMRLDGTHYVRASRQSTAIFDSDDFTFEFWFNASAPGVLLNEVDAVDTTQWDYALAELLPTGKLKTQIPGMAVLEAGTISLGTWHHLALTYNSTEQKSTTYLDGSPVGADFGGRFTPKSAGRVVNYAYGRGGPTNLGGGGWFAGLMDEVRIWKRALSAEEVRSVFDKRLDNFDAALMAYWRFDEAPGAAPSDASGKLDTPVYSGGTLPIVTSDAPVQFDLRPTIGTVSGVNINPLFSRFVADIANHNEDSIAYFEFSGTNGTYRSQIVALGSAQTNSTLSQIIDFLTLGNYTVHVIASNHFGLIRGTDIAFQKTGWAGAAVRLTNTTTISQYVRTAASQNTNFDESITVELWCNPKTNGVVMTETSFPTPSSLDRSVIEIARDGTVYAGFDGVPTITLGRANFGAWNFIALRYDKIKLLMDGFLNQTKSLSSSGDRLTPAEKNVQGYFAFGRKPTTFLTATANSGFSGDLDEVRVWRTVRTDDQILQEQSAKPEIGPDLGLYWDFDDVTGPGIVQDVSSHHVSGQEIGGGVSASTAPITFTFVPITTLDLVVAKMAFLVSAGIQYRLDVSEDLVNWTASGTNVPTSLGLLQTSDQIDRNRPAKFYRLTPLQ